jgi:hypothetical protein
MTGVGGGPAVSRSLHGTTVGSGRVSGSPCLRPALVEHIGRCATEMASFGVNGA